MTPVLHAHELVKRFRGTVAVDGVTVVVEPGERVGLLGPNGAGKTTTLLMMLGAVTPDDGFVEVAGHRLPRGRSRAMAEVGFAAGYLPLPERLRVREYLQLFGRLYGAHDVDAAIDATLERFGVGHLAGAMGVELSSGQRTLVGIVKAVLHRPRLLVLDEPTASLDPEMAARVRVALERQCAADGTALLVTSHNMSDVHHLCQRVVFVSRGRVVADDTPAAVIARFGAQNLEGVFLDLAGASGAPGGSSAHAPPADPFDEARPHTPVAKP